MTDYVIMPKADYQGACDAIRAKTGKTDQIKSGDMATEIEEIKTGGGRTTASPKDVNFYDYDGALLHSYTVEEAQNLSALPELPTQKRLICQGWNYDLETIKSYNRAINVGATYITDDGKTRLYIKIAAEGRMDVPLYFQQTVANGVTIDWGDGSATETLSGTGNVNTVHTYASIGDYVITLDAVEGCTLGLGHKNENSYCILGSTGDGGKVYCNMLQKVEIGDGVISIGNYAFKNCYSLLNISIPNSVTSIGNNTFTYCYSLLSINIPDSVTSIDNFPLGYCYSLSSISIPDSVRSISNGLLRYCHSLSNISIPNSVTSIFDAAVDYCYSLSSISIPDSVTNISSFAFRGCYGMKFYDFTSHTAIPTLSGTDTFANIPSDCEIRVPASLYDEWIAATNWSTYAANIVAV